MNGAASSSGSRSGSSNDRSNSNGTYYGLSIEHVNRNAAGYVDFEKVRRIEVKLMVDDWPRRDRFGQCGGRWTIGAAHCRPTLGKQGSRGRSSSRRE